jgi:integrase
VLFEYAGVTDFTEHDLRHTATCNWFMLRDQTGRWMFSDVELCRIMGWTSTRMAVRYASFRAEDLSARLG